jgi:hypothetical protein
LELTKPSILKITIAGTGSTHLLKSVLFCTDLLLAHVNWRVTKYSLTVTVLHSLPRAVMGPRLASVVSMWLLIGILSAPLSPNYSLVTRLALSIAGKQMPYTRDDLLKKF